MTERALARWQVGVVGRGLAGTFTALALRRRGLSVALFSHGPDSGDMGGIYRVPATAATPEPASGELVDQAARRAIFDTGVACVDDATLVQVGASGATITGVDGQSHVDRVLFAPHGTEIGAPELRALEFLGRGVSKDASSDAPSYRGQPVTVLGSGPRAAEQALIARAAGASMVTVLVEQAHPSFGLLGVEIEAAAGIRVERGVIPIRLLPRADGALAAVEFLSAAGASSVLETACLQLARGLVPDMTRLAWSDPPRQSARPIAVLGGLAVGLPWSDHAAQLAEVERLVTALAA